MLFLSHLSSLRKKERRERLEWIGDAVMGEIFARLLAREALATLARKGADTDAAQIPPTLQPLAQRCGTILEIVASNANLRTVYSVQLGGVIEKLGFMQEDHRLSISESRRCSSDIGPGGELPSPFGSPKGRRQKCRPDFVEAVIGEAFHASLSRTTPRGRAHQFVGGNRAGLVDSLLATALSTEVLLTYLESGELGQLCPENPHPGTIFNSFSALEGDDDEDEFENLSPTEDCEENIKTPSGAGTDAVDPLCRISMSPAVSLPSERGKVGRSQLQARDMERDRNGIDEVDSEREGILRLYGATLLTFRVSVFLFCSGAGNQQGPKDLTLRRQNVMCTENLQAIAEHLHASMDTEPETSSMETEIGNPSPPGVQKVPPGSAPSPNWLRTEVGRSSLSAHNQAFSTRIAALLLSRAGEVKEDTVDGIISDTIAVSTSKYTSRTKRHVGKQRACSAKGSAESGAKCGNISADLATSFTRAGAGGHVTLDPWEDKNFPLARVKASDIFSPRYKPPPNTTVAGKRSTSSGDQDLDRDHYNDQRHRRRKRKLTRTSRGDAVVNSDVPPHYAGLVGKLPRDKRRLLARLGNNDCVKVFEAVLNGFVHSNPCSPTDQSSYAPSGLLPSPSKGDVGNITASEEYKVEGTLDAPENAWLALVMGKPHPALNGLVKPPQLAQAKRDRLVLPIPNPFFRLVVHTLCSIHGLCSKGGESMNEGVGGDHGGERRHRTVEITFFRGRERDNVSRHSLGGVVTGKLVPVETLLKRTHSE